MGSGGKEEAASRESRPARCEKMQLGIYIRTRVAACVVKLAISANSIVASPSHFPIGLIQNKTERSANSEFWDAASAARLIPLSRQSLK